MPLSLRLIAPGVTAQAAGVMAKSEALFRPLVPLHPGRER
jgi:hypothetical protein